MAIPASLPLARFYRPGAHASGLHKLRIQLSVAPNAVLLNHNLAFRNCRNHLMLSTQSKNLSMAGAIFGFEIPFSENIILRHVTIIANRIAPVRAVLPGRIKRPHDVAVYANVRVIQKIRVSSRSITHIGYQPNEYPAEQYGYRFGPSCRQKEIHYLKKVLPSDFYISVYSHH